MSHLIGVRAAKRRSTFWSFAWSCCSGFSRRPIYVWDGLCQPPIPAATSSWPGTTPIRSGTTFYQTQSGYMSDYFTGSKVDFPSKQPTLSFRNSFGILYICGGILFPGREAVHIIHLLQENIETPSNPPTVQCISGYGVTSAYQRAANPGDARVLANPPISASAYSLSRFLIINARRHSLLPARST